MDIVIIGMFSIYRPTKHTNKKEDGIGAQTRGTRHIFPSIPTSSVAQCTACLTTKQFLIVFRRVWAILLIVVVAINVANRNRVVYVKQQSFSSYRPI